MRTMSLAIQVDADDKAWIAEVFAGLSPTTRDTYCQDLGRFSLWLVPRESDEEAAISVREACRRFLEGGSEAGHSIAWNYREAMMRMELGAGTINRRLSALRALTKRCRQTGRIDWTLDVPGLRAPPARLYRLSPADVFRLIDALTRPEPHRCPPKTRDACAIRLTWDLGLRRDELLGVDVADVDLAQQTIRILRKRQSEKGTERLPPESVKALGRWLECRRLCGIRSPALFVQFGRFEEQHQRLSLRGWAKTFKCRCRDILARELSPHALRHGSITCALDMTNGNVARVKGYAHHEDIRTTVRYDDMRQADPAKIAHLVSSAVPDPLDAPIASNSARIEASASLRTRPSLKACSALESAARSRSTLVGFEHDDEHDSVEGIAAADEEDSIEISVLDDQDEGD